MRIIVDLDGTLIAQDTNWHGPDTFGQPVPGAQRALRIGRLLGHRYLLWTTRQRSPVLTYLRKIGADILFDDVNQIPKDWQETEIDSPKPYYDLHLDDRSTHGGFRFGEPCQNWTPLSWGCFALWVLRREKIPGVRPWAREPIRQQLILLIDGLRQYARMRRVWNAMGFNGKAEAAWTMEITDPGITGWADVKAVTRHLCVEARKLKRVKERQHDS